MEQLVFPLTGPPSPLWVVPHQCLLVALVGGGPLVVSELLYLPYPGVLMMKPGRKKVSFTICKYALNFLGFGVGWGFRTGKLLLQNVCYILLMTTCYILLMTTIHLLDFIPGHSMVKTVVY